MSKCFHALKCRKGKKKFKTTGNNERAAVTLPTNGHMPRFCKLMAVCAAASKFTGSSKEVKMFSSSIFLWFRN